MRPWFRIASIWSALLLLGALAGVASGHPLDTLEPGHWYEVPSSHLRDVCPPNDLYGGDYEWHFYCRHVIGAWSGGAFDTTRQRLVVWGGGHADYAGNEVYVFDVESLQWSRLNDPSSLDGFCDGSSCQPQAQVMPDGKPPSRHTYNGMVYVPSIDRLWSQGGSLWKSGNATLLTWTFDFVTQSWSQMSDAEDTSYSIVTAYDPVTQHVFHHGNDTLSEYDPVADEWTMRADWEASFPLGTTAAIDPGRRKLVMIGRGYALIYDLTPSGPLVLESLVTSGATEIVNGNAPGFVYDPAIDKFVAWSGEPDIGLAPQDLFVLDLDSRVWSRISPAASNTVIPTVASSTGTFGRFQYLPARNAYVVVNHVDNNVFFYRLSAAGTAIFADDFESGNAAAWSAVVP